MKAYLKKEDEPKKTVVEQIEKNKTFEVESIDKRTRKNN